MKTPNSLSYKNILSLNHEEALDYFLVSDRYCGFELPEYFDFTTILQYVRNKLSAISFDECFDKDPTNEPDINLEILLNKDGKYGVRPLTLVNPFIYYFLCNEICEKDNWKGIQGCFRNFAVPHIQSCAIPIIPNDKEAFHKSSVILNWWNSMEQRSIELALKYRYMFVTDITNCYGSINPDSIDWALALKDTQKCSYNLMPLSTSIKKYIKALQQGRNIGIPQGSCIFDFIAEMVLGYADLLLHEAIVNSSIDFGDYEILRYRDDYRIFSNDKEKLEKLSYLLQQVLERLNFRMNTKKTFVSDDLIADSIKPDKLTYIYNTPIFNKKGCDFDGIQKHFLYLLLFCRKHPNAGQLKSMLSDLDHRIEKRLKPRQRTCKVIDENGIHEKVEVVQPHIRENITAIISIAVQLAVENVSAVNYVLRVISRLLNDIEDDSKREMLLAHIYKRLSSQPNSTYTQVWLQNITYRTDMKNKNCPYSLPLCRLVMGHDIALWNNSWLKQEFTGGLPLSSIVVRETLEKNNSIITFRETRAYYEM